MKKQRWSLLALLFALVLALAACNGGSTTEEKPKDEETNKSEETTTTPDETATESDALFDVAVTNDGDAISGGMLKVAMVKDEPFAGIFTYELYEDGYDADILAFASNSLFETDGNFMITDKGIASLEVDQENNKAIVKIREGVKWSDGTPLTIEDVIQPYLIIGNKDYTGVRYDTSFKNIIGAEEYHAGTADTISGLKKIDETTLEISFKELSPSIFYGGDGLWTYAAPVHQVGDIPIAELVENDAVRKNPITLGAFKFDKIVPGESVQFLKNEHYWKGKPKLDGVLIKSYHQAQFQLHWYMANMIS